MKTFLCLLALLPSIASAESAQYEGMFRGAPVVLTVQTNLPSAVEVYHSPGMIDPELGVIPASVSVKATPASLNLNVGGRNLRGVLAASGVETEQGLALVSFEGYFPLLSEGGVVYGGALFLPASAVVSGTQVTAFNLPESFDARWEVEGNYPADDIHRGDAPTVHFTRK